METADRNNFCVYNDRGDDLRKLKEATPIFRGGKQYYGRIKGLLHSSDEPFAPVVEIEEAVNYLSKEK